MVGQRVLAPSILVQIQVLQPNQLNMQNNDEFIKDQFRIFKKRGGYRDVLMHTSFIEAVVKNKANLEKSGQFKQALEKLGLKIDKTNEKNACYRITSNYKDYKNSCLIEINLLRFQRNELLHDIIKKKLDQEYINNTIKEMKQKIRLVYTKSKLIRDFFTNNFGIDPSDLLK